MDYCVLLTLSTLALASAWSVPFYPVRGPQRVTRFAPHPPHPQHPPHLPHHRPQIIPVREAEEQEWQRPKRDHDYDHDHDHDHDRDHGHQGHHGHGHGHSGVTGPVHTFVKTDKNANYKWGVRHHVGNKFAS